VAAFLLLRHRRNEPKAFLYAFDLLELNGTDLRREPIEVRKATLASILRKARHGVRLNEHMQHDCGLTVFLRVSSNRANIGTRGHHINSPRHGSIRVARCENHDVAHASDMEGGSAMKRFKCSILAAVLLATLGVPPNLAKAATISQASTSVDLAAQTVSFHVVWSAIPDFLSVDSAGRPADQFRFHIMPLAGC
jgi:hypothetical protein